MGVRLAAAGWVRISCALRGASRLSLDKIANLNDGSPVKVQQSVVYAVSMGDADWPSALFRVLLLGRTQRRVTQGVHSIARPFAQSRRTRDLRTPDHRHAQRYLGILRGGRGADPVRANRMLARGQNATYPAPLEGRGARCLPCSGISRAVPTSDCHRESAAGTPSIGLPPVARPSPPKRTPGRSHVAGTRSASANFTSLRDSPFQVMGPSVRYPLERPIDGCSPHREEDACDRLAGPAFESR